MARLRSTALTARGYQDKEHESDGSDGGVAPDEKE